MPNEIESAEPALLCGRGVSGRAPTPTARLEPLSTPSATYSATAAPSSPSRSSANELDGGGVSFRLSDGSRGLKATAGTRSLVLLALLDGFLAGGQRKGEREAEGWFWRRRRGKSRKRMIREDDEEEEEEAATAMEVNKTHEKGKKKPCWTPLHFQRGQGILEDVAVTGRKESDRGR
ncbi:hypothetical protein BHE74_00004780 [Ensete ventricosum]|uniref:Uncharacterized protein n=1 Tax=Ensete ventricosum TaxID=4639 RepID=A0A444FWN8_ENSVE|nr:hypothetical protein B296_00003589 [Ensete ventricosum]RWW27029.1 hypothetical protein GW17_00008561 [Ensete ventricosum]RWW86450.1 hypothetical protein BHE74_00004780 [Ensete ventricosum]